MPPRAPTNATIQQQQQQQKWVNVTWMPNVTLSQQSHVCLSVRSAHATLDTLTTTMHGEEMEWKIRVGIYAIGGSPLVPLTSCTPFSPVVQRRQRQTTTSTATTKKMQQQRPLVGDVTHDCIFDYFLQLPVRWRDLPRDAYLLFEILGMADNVVYEATLPFFSQYGRLETGLQKLEFRRPKSHHSDDKNLGLHPLCPRGQQVEKDDDLIWKASCIMDQLERFEEKARTPIKPAVDGYTSFGQTPSVPWLDVVMKERVKDILADESSSVSNSVFPLLDDRLHAFLVVELPVFDIPIMHEETFYPIPQQGASGAVTPLDLAVYRKQRMENNKEAEDAKSFDPLELVTFLDYEDEHDNPVEDKYRTLAHDLLRGLVDPALKPDRKQRDRLSAIIDSTSHHLTREEKDLLWRFRFSLVDNRRALTKFLLAVDWTVDSEVVQAAELLEQWRKRSPIEVTDALKLLGKHVAFQTNLVRSYAIDTLEAAPDSELRLYLLQLVQALKYENMEIPEPGTMARVGMAGTSQVSSLATFLIRRAAGNMSLANFLYWYLKVELDNPTHGARYREVFQAFENRLSETPFSLFGGDDHAEKTAFKSIVDTVSSKIGTTFRSEGGHDKDRSSSKKTKARTMWDVLLLQDQFISGILDIQQQCRDSRGKKDAKEEMLRMSLAKEGYSRSPSRDAIPLPSAPEIYVNGVHPETAKIFKSALYPALVDFHVEATVEEKRDGKRTVKVVKDHKPSSFKVIVKTGDDLRQDQLIMMMIQLMDGLLKRAALDLCLTPYSILATSVNSGMVQFVEGSIPISQILSSHNNSILQFFQANAGQKGEKYDVRPEVMATYIRSCAGYCVITYILAVGDRHLDNILLRASGHFFHIDFGFIFGRDPKPLPPAFRLTREMVDGMGGVESSEYRQFCSLACQAFNALRKSAGLIINLLHLMSDAGIEDLSNNPAADAEGVINKVEERFRLDLTDEQAESYFVGLINDCLTALAPRVMDVFHSFSVARR